MTIVCPKYDEKRVADYVAEKCLCVRGLIELQSSDASDRENIVKYGINFG